MVLLDSGRFLINTVVVGQLIAHVLYTVSV